MPNKKSKKVVISEGSMWEFKCILCGCWGGSHVQGESFPYTPQEWAEKNKDRPPMEYDGKMYSSAYPEDGEPCRGDGEHGSDEGCTGTMVWIDQGWQEERPVTDKT